MKKKTPSMKEIMRRDVSVNIAKVENGYVVTCSSCSDSGDYKSEKYIAKTESEAKKKASELL